MLKAAERGAADPTREDRSSSNVVLGGIAFVAPFHRFASKRERYGIHRPSSPNVTILTDRSPARSVGSTPACCAFTALLPQTEQASRRVSVTSSSRVSHFMNKFRQLGFIDYNGHLEVHNSLVGVLRADQPRTVSAKLNIVQ